MMSNRCTLLSPLVLEVPGSIPARGEKFSVQTLAGMRLTQCTVFTGGPLAGRDIHCAGVLYTVTNFLLSVCSGPPCKTDSLQEMDEYNQLWTAMLSNYRQYLEQSLRCPHEKSLGP